MANQQDIARLNIEIMNKFLEDLIKVIEEDCKRYFVKKMQESIQDVVYDAYTPTQYKRRKTDEGLQDPNNYTLEAKLDADGRVCVFMKNMTRGVGKAYYIDEGIVTGRNFYDWKKSNAYYYATHGGFERDFYTYMEFIVVNDSELHELIKRGMKRKGWKIK